MEQVGQDHHPSPGATIDCGCRVIVFRFEERPKYADLVKERLLRCLETIGFDGDYYAIERHGSWEYLLISGATAAAIYFVNGFFGHIGERAASSIINKTNRLRIESARGAPCLPLSKDLPSAVHDGEVEEVHANHTIKHFVDLLNDKSIDGLRAVEFNDFSGGRSARFNSITMYRYVETPPAETSTTSVHTRRHGDVVVSINNFRDIDQYREFRNTLYE